MRWSIDVSIFDNHRIVICNCVFPDQSRPVRERSFELGRLEADVALLNSLSLSTLSYL